MQIDVRRFILCKTQLEQKTLAPLDWECQKVVHRRRHGTIDE
jgi:hypothetical protein